MVFVNSMSDMFHNDVPVEFIHDMLQVVESCPQHQFQVLTKRPQRMRRVLTEYYAERDVLPNLWMGVSIESDAYSWRGDYLRETPAAIRWISAEPLLGELTNLNLDRVDWVVVGGESGDDARVADPDWVRHIRDASASQGVPFFFKGWGQWVPEEQKSSASRTHLDHQSKDNDKPPQNFIDGKQWDQFPEMNSAHPPQQTLF